MAAVSKKMAQNIQRTDAVWLSLNCFLLPLQEIKLELSLSFLTPAAAGFMVRRGMGFQVHVTERQYILEECLVPVSQASQIWDTE